MVDMVLLQTIMANFAILQTAPATFFQKAGGSNC